MSGWSFSNVVAVAMASASSAQSWFSAPAIRPDRSRKWLLAISSGTKYLELASDEVDHRLQVVRRAVSAGLGLGGLDEAVDAFKDAIGDVGVVPAQDALPVPLDGPGRVDHRLEAAVGGPEVPRLEEGLGGLT